MNHCESKNFTNNASSLNRKSEKSLDMGELTFCAEKTACYRLQQQTKVCVLALVRQTTVENCTKSTQ